jgi:hypothetical protein
MVKSAFLLKILISMQEVLFGKNTCYQYRQSKLQRCHY